ncbi:unnamed protein product [Candidula unifasciata]|uniref:G-protein coupled receptors family 1 profile domain-containing protein n=1 Tax=Candidula unifasciata TaxID=100452 RepID=A0A8S3ZEI0_9EUPU|nr:unnamed protein product [Candidula unifasciata]
MANATNLPVTNSDLMTTQQFFIVAESCAIVWAALSIFGIISNTINIKIFIIMGMGDSGTVSLLALSIFDLLYSIIALCAGVSGILAMVELRCGVVFAIEPFGVGVIFANVMTLINVPNTLVTTFIAVARCMCVAKPLHFRNMFTRTRTVICSIVFTLFAVVVYVPVLTNMGVVMQFDRRRNISRLSLWVSHDREFVKDIVWMITDVILPFTTQFIVIVSVVIMARGLRIASSFRQSYASNVVTEPGTDSKKADNNAETETLSDNILSSHTLTKKEFRVIQQIILISVVYIICNTPKILASTAATIEPQYTFGGRYNNIYLAINLLRKHFEIVNASVNTFIYYAYNTKFRNTLHL